MFDHENNVYHTCIVYIYIYNYYILGVVQNVVYIIMSIFWTPDGANTVLLSQDVQVQPWCLARSLNFTGRPVRVMEHRVQAPWPITGGSWRGRRVAGWHGDGTGPRSSQCRTRPPDLPDGAFQEVVECHFVWERQTKISQHVHTKISVEFNLF